MERRLRSEEEIEAKMKEFQLNYEQRKAEAIERAKNSLSDEIIIYCNNLLSIASKKLDDVIEQSELRSIPYRVALKNIEEYH